MKNIITNINKIVLIGLFIGLLGTIENCDAVQFRLTEKDDGNLIAELKKDKELYIGSVLSVAGLAGLAIHSPQELWRLKYLLKMYGIFYASTHLSLIAHEVIGHGLTAAALGHTINYVYISPNFTPRGTVNFKSPFQENSAKYLRNNVIESIMGPIAGITTNALLAYWFCKSNYFDDVLKTTGLISVMVNIINDTKNLIPGSATGFNNDGSHAYIAWQKLQYLKKSKNDNNNIPPADLSDSYYMSNFPTKPCLAALTIGGLAGGYWLLKQAGINNIFTHKFEVSL